MAYRSIFGNFGQNNGVVTPGATFQRYLEYFNENYGATLPHIELSKYAIKSETRHSRTSTIKVGVELKTFN